MTGNPAMAGSAAMAGEAAAEWESLTETGGREGAPAAGRLLNWLPDAEERALFAQKLEQMGLPPQSAAAVRSGTAGMAQLADAVLELLEKGVFSRRALRELLEQPGLRGLLQSRMEHNWLLDPEREGLDKETVFRLYTRLQEQTAHLAQALDEAGASQSGMARSVAQMRENLDFLQQLNQTFTYVQLPLRLSSQQTHGDLYVYTNKKNLARKDGTVSALLHLDMEHLGSMDIYVALTQEKVSTRFYLEREELLDFLEQNMHILDEHLSRRGYRMEYELCRRERPAGVLEEMLKQDGSASVLSQYAFDVRA